MARRQRGRPVHGWLLIDKPAGPTSAQVVAKVRWALDARKAGHAGTLDPAATGLLAIALGEATKTVPYVTDADKCYRFTVRWGVRTATDDAEGEVIATSGARPAREAIETALGAFRGDILQIPPNVSAVKVEGERAYDLARAGEVLDLAARPLHVARLDLIGTPDADTAILEMECGKGGYVRAIARDLGEALGCHGHVIELRRLWSGPFDVDEALGLDEVERLARTPDLDRRLLGLEAGLGDLPCLPATPQGATRLRNGNPGLVLSSTVDYGDEAWASYEGAPVAIGIYRGGELHPTRVFRLDAD
ncbi:tRNA pseudouridine(55) synthase TruB [Amaricoccus sp. W119]|uniref:tRNA pseudouridine(55) synthase TruB n=1 Tax=Amaricoccus sp. W119 TaxID=3391833 RepID=UPI0039A41B2B